MFDSPVQIQVCLKNFLHSIGLTKISLVIEKFSVVKGRQ